MVSRFTDAFLLAAFTCDGASNKVNGAFYASYTKALGWKMTNNITFAYRFATRNDALIQLANLHFEGLQVVVARIR